MNWTEKMTLIWTITCHCFVFHRPQEQETLSWQLLLLKLLSDMK